MHDVRARVSERVGSSTCCSIRLKQGENYKHMLATYIYSHCNIRLKTLEHTLTYVYSHCNICKIQMKHMQYLDETAQTFGTHTCNVPIKTTKNIWNIHLQHTCIAITICATSRSKFSSIQMKYMQHLDETSEILETYTCNMRFQHNHLGVLGRMKARRHEGRR
jgi:hypothetical protein